MAEETRRPRLVLLGIVAAAVLFGEKQIGGSGGSLEPPGPLLARLHTVYMAYSKRRPTRLNPLPWLRGCVSPRCCSCTRTPHCTRRTPTTRPVRALFVLPSRVPYSRKRQICLGDLNLARTQICVSPLGLPEISADDNQKERGVISGWRFQHTPLLVLLSHNHQASFTTP